MGNLLSLPHSPFVYCAFNTLFEGNFQILLVTIAAALNPYNTLFMGNAQSRARDVTNGILSLSTPFSRETMPNSLIFYYSSTCCRATFSGREFLFAVFRCL